MAVVRHMPRVTCHVNCYTELEKLDDKGAIVGIQREKKVCASDYLKVEFRVKYEHLDEDETEGYVYSRNFPFLKKHSWHIVMCDA